MNITYTGRQGTLPVDQQKKLDVKLTKLAKMIERKGSDKGAHVAVTTERHLTKAEISVNYYDHPLACLGSGPDFFSALTMALDKLEKQVIKVQTKWRDGKRGPKEKGEPANAPKVSAEPAEPALNVFRVNHHERRKPMTVEEALIAIGGRDYLVYRDSDKDSISVLIRRRDGHFDLVES